MNRQEAEKFLLAIHDGEREDDVAEALASEAFKESEHKDDAVLCFALGDNPKRSAFARAIEAAGYVHLGSVRDEPYYLVLPAVLVCAKCNAPSPMENHGMVPRCANCNHININMKYVENGHPTFRKDLSNPIAVYILKS